MAKGYAEGPAAEEAERRRDELERGGGKRKAEQRLAVYGSTEDEPERAFHRLARRRRSGRAVRVRPGLGPERRARQRGLT